MLSLPCQSVLAVEAVPPTSINFSFICNNGSILIPFIPIARMDTTSILRLYGGCAALTSLSPALLSHYFTKLLYHATIPRYHTRICLGVL